MKRSLWMNAWAMMFLGCNIVRAPVPLPPPDISPPPPGRTEEAEPYEPPPRDEEAIPAPRPLDGQQAVIALPAEVAEGPKEGLTLQDAITRLIAVNRDLAGKFQDIPKGRADVLTAGLRTDPVVFLSATAIPYTRYSEQRPGATRYDVTVVQSIDVSGKHKAGKSVAEKTIPVLEARYQDAVRLEIDRLHTIYVNVLEARATAWAARSNLEILTQAAELAREQSQRGQRPSSDVARMSIQLARARIALQRAEAGLLHARRNLGTLLALPPNQTDTLQVRGSLQERSPVPCTEELLALASRNRPDLAAHRLSVARAQSEVRREQAEALEDVFLFFSPYQSSDNSPVNKQSTNTWQLGLLLPIPAFNRNQGEIARARANVVQWGLEADRAEQEVSDEVRRAVMEYDASRQTVEQYQRDLLANARSLRDEKFRQFAAGDKDIRSFLAAQKDYDEVLHDYLSSLARRRRNSLRLNTVVGQRLFP